MKHFGNYEFDCIYLPRLLPDRGLNIGSNKYSVVVIVPGGYSQVSQMKLPVSPLAVREAALAEGQPG